MRKRLEAPSANLQPVEEPKERAEGVKIQAGLGPERPAIQCLRVTWSFRGSHRRECDGTHLKKKTIDHQSWCFRQSPGKYAALLQCHAELWKIFWIRCWEYCWTVISAFMKMCSESTRMLKSWCCTLVLKIKLTFSVKMSFSSKMAFRKKKLTTEFYNTNITVTWKLGDMIGCIDKNQDFFRAWVRPGKKENLLLLMISLSYKVLFKNKLILQFGAFSSMEQLWKFMDMFTPMWPVYQEDNSKTCKKLDFFLHSFIYVFILTHYTQWMEQKLRDPKLIWHSKD